MRGRSSTCSGKECLRLSDGKHVAFRGNNGIGLVDVTTGTVQFREHHGSPYSWITYAASVDSLAATWARNVTFYDEALDLQSTLVVPRAPSIGLLSVQANGSFRASERVRAQLRCVLLRWWTVPN